MGDRLTEPKIRNAAPAAPGKRYYLTDDLLPGFMVRVTDRGTKTYSAMTRLNGQLIRVTLGRWPAIGLAEARRRARDAVEAASRGEDPRRRAIIQRAENQRRLGETFQSVAEAFKARHLAGLRSGTDLRRDIERAPAQSWPPL